jgi:hypothetical protein
MLSRFLALCLLLAASAAGQNPTAPKRGEIVFELTSLGRDASGSTITAAVKARNTSTSSVVFLLLVSEPTAVDSSGGTYGNARVNGMAYCSRADRMVCVTKDSSWFVPLASYTEIGPEQTATFTVVLKATPSNSKGDKITLAEQVAYRVMKEADRDKDANMPEAQKLKTLRFGSMSFNGPPEAEGYAVSKISFEDIK